MMNSGTECSVETIQYRLNLPYSLHSISPALSALHASRATLLHPEVSAILHPSHCPHCGTYYFSGDYSTHLIGPSTKKKRKHATSSHTKPLWRRCHLCGFSVDMRTSPSLNHSIQFPGSPLKPETVPTIPQIKEIDQESPPTNIPRPVATTVPKTTCSPVPPLICRQSQPKSSHTKAFTLRDMLSRDRQREEAVKAHKKRRESREGLAAFLKGL